MFVMCENVFFFVGVNENRGVGIVFFLVCIDKMNEICDYYSYFVVKVYLSYFFFFWCVKVI